MKRLWQIVLYLTVAAIILLLVSNFSLNDLVGPKVNRAEYVFSRVIDGDTIEVEDAGEKMKVRLIGINSPEAYEFESRKIECFGPEASNEAKRFFGDVARVWLVFDPNKSVDIYSRRLAYVEVNGRDFGTFMIKNGFAYEYTYQKESYTRQVDYRKLEDKARKDRVGLWAKCY